MTTYRTNTNKAHLVVKGILVGACKLQLWEINSGIRHLLDKKRSEPHVKDRIKLLKSSERPLCYILGRLEQEKGSEDS